MNLGGPALCLAYRQALPNDLLSQSLLDCLILEGEKCSTMTCRETALDNEALNGRGQIQEPHGVRDGGARPADSSRNIFLGQAEVIDQLPVGRGLFKSVEILAVDVLNDGGLERSLVIRVPHERRNASKASALCGSPTSLPCNDFISF